MSGFEKTGLYPSNNKPVITKLVLAQRRQRGAVNPAFESLLPPETRFQGASDTVQHLDAKYGEILSSPSRAALKQVCAVVTEAAVLNTQARSLWNVPPSSTPLPPTWSPHTCDLQQASTPTSIGRQASEMNYKAGAQNSQNSGPETPLAQRSGRIRPIRIALSNGRKTLICSRPLFQSRGSYSTTMIPGGMRRTKDPFSAKRRRFRPPHSRFSRGNDWPSHRLRRTQLERKRDPAWSLVRQLRRRIQGPRSFRRRRLPRLSSTRHETSIPAPSPDGRHIASRLPRWNHQGISLR
ncbi:DNA transposase ESP4 [Ilyonectria robusta]